MGLGRAAAVGLGAVLGLQLLMSCRLAGAQVSGQRLGLCGHRALVLVGPGSAALGLGPLALGLA